MDNFTHTLAGLLFAEAALAWRRASGAEPGAAPRLALCAASIAANNLPDVDFAYARRLTPGALGYLLHHRGHSHTLLVALLGGVATFFVTLAILRAAKRAPSAPDRRRLLALCLLGPVAHIALDFNNNYGVHPFWPIHDGWFYGDTLFIIEPWLWVVCLPPLAFLAKSLAARAILGSCLLVTLGLAWTLRLVPFGAALALTLGAALSSLLAARANARRRVAGAAAASLVVTGCFASSTRSAEASMRDAARGARPAIDVLDVVITPMPGNPLCATSILIGEREGAYVLRTASVAIAPALVTAAECRIEGSDPSALLVPLNDRSPAVAWHAEWAAPAADLRRLAAENCEIRALLRFTRAPFWVSTGDGYLAGDLRYDRRPGLDFSEITTRARPSTCPRWVPPWTPPLHALLRGAY